MAAVSKLLSPVRGLGKGQLTLLSSVTGGHAVIHWYQQLFPLIIPQVKAGLGLTDVEVGYFSAARQAAVGAANLPSGIIADAWFSRRAVMLAASLVFMGAAYFLVGIAPSLLWALPGAMLVGLGTAVWHPPAMASLSTRFPGRRATALAMHGMGATFSDTLTPIAFGGLLVLFHWRGVLQMQMIPALIAALIVWRALAGQFNDAPAPPQGGRFRDVGMLLRNPVFAGVSFAQGLMAMSRNVILTFLPLYIQVDLGYNAFELGLYVALLHGMGIISQPILGIVADRFGRKRVLVPSYIVVGAMYLLLVAAAPGWQLVLLVLALGVLFYTLTNVTTAAVLDVAGAGVQASSMGLMSVFTQLIALPALVAGGWLAEHMGYGSTFIMSAAFMFAGALLMLPLRMYQGSHKTARFSG